MRNSSNQKGFAHILAVLLLLVGIGVGVYLVTSGNPLKLFPKAGGAPIFFMNLDGSPLPVNFQGVAQASSPTVKVGLSSTLGPPAPVSGPIGSNTTVAYRGALNPGDLQKGDFAPYTADPMIINIELENRPGIQIFWVDFKSASGKIDRKAAKIELTTANPGASSTPRVTPLPTPPLTPPASCLPRPSCLDSKPRCLLPEPADGWCPSSLPTPSLSPVSGAKQKKPL